MKLNKINLNKNHGFSIVEIVVYLAIFTAISILVINSFVVVLSSSSSIRSNHDLLDSGTTAMERMALEIRQAKNADLTNSVRDSNSGTLQLTNTDGVSYVKFTKSGNTLALSQDGTSLGNLLVQNISLNSLKFTRIITTQGEAIRIEMTLQDTRGKVNKIEKFYDTVVVRGGY